ncbi:hypothetical protein JRI60_39915 [Archangium violaceum]|uniref:hypothetical protein n=1 Tax=Archangium violaceum TaxID=83451 RepID=UPI00194E3A4B|nr:hypothetical protein [Archangium violaceum]QRN95190.1 hypothetical protein JRI60_39915 [Archangium violaceum]
MLLWTATLACGPAEEAPGDEEPASQRQAARSSNSETLNGLAFNGLAFNGLAFNGLAFNGLNSASFSAWFQQNDSLADMVMRYVVTCAVPAGETRMYTDPQGRTYVWAGSLGLAPDWANGQPATVREQQLVSGCLAAHVNKYGRTVPISILGANARGQPIPTTQAELQEFSQREGCFFGNLFKNEGIYVGNDASPLGRNRSSVRACALSGRSDECPPIVPIGSCAASCTPDATNTYYTRCNRNGITYVPLITRIHPQDIYVCGDGTCQFTESCGIGLSTVQCTLDCGICR